MKALLSMIFSLVFSMMVVSFLQIPSEAIAIINGMLGANALLGVALLWLATWGE